MNKLIEDSFKKSIKCDIIKELLNKYDTLELNMNYITYKKFIINRVNVYSEHPNFIIRDTNVNKYVSRKMTKNKKNKCIARLWNNSCGGQCSHISISNNLCIKHNNMIKKYDKLRFNTINEEYPKNDNINGNLLQWNI
jgi:hypothetical protein